jgi:Escherichia/Staphylococcus phage prohead protease
MGLDQLVMELRSVDQLERVVVGVVAPYGEISFLTPNPAGERIRPGAFAKSLRQRAAKIPLFRSHDHTRKLGQSRSFSDDGTALIGEFAILPGEHGDLLLEDLRLGYLDGMSAGMRVLNATRGRDGATEVREAMLAECSVTALAAYEGAALLSVRNAQTVNPPAVNLSPLPPLGYRPR